LAHSRLRPLSARKTVSFHLKLNALNRAQRA